MNLLLVSGFSSESVSLLYHLFLGTSTTDLRLEIAREDAALAEAGADQPHEMTPALLIQKGLALEEEQYVYSDIWFY